MEIDKILHELDSLPGGEETRNTGLFLKEKIELAKEEADTASELTLLNEMIGYCRYTGRHEESAQYSEEALKLCADQGLEGQIPYATTLLNAATADRAAGRLDLSFIRYSEVEEIYSKRLETKDYLYAALYNNMSLLYQAMNRDEESASYLIKALEILSDKEKHRAEQAITLTNLGQAYIRLKRYEDAAVSLEKAEDIFEELGGNDFHYPECLNAMAQLLYIGKDYASSVRYYERALKLLKYHVGEDNPGYIAVYENMKEAVSKMSAGTDEREETSEPEALYNDMGHEMPLKGLELSRRFYLKYGAPMIHEKFSEYEEYITTGLVGRGSQCYGYDDELSTDHDFGPDFCLWLDDDLYERIGEELQKAYDELPAVFMGYKRVTALPPDGRRVGVIRTKEFYCRILEVGEDLLDAFTESQKDMVSADDPAVLELFTSVREENLSGCTNGEIFREGRGDFARIRNKLSYYPDIIWKRRIAEELHYSAQMGQYNYIRMLKRGEKVTSEIALAGYMEHTMKLVYLINRRYAPYYKWLHHGMADLEKAVVIMDIFNAVYDMPKGDERIRMTIEIVAAIIIEELEKIGMAGNVPSEEKYLDVYSQVIINNAR